MKKEKFNEGDLCYDIRMDKLLIYQGSLNTWLGLTHMFQSGYNTRNGKASFNFVKLISKSEFTFKADKK